MLKNETQLLFERDCFQLRMSFPRLGTAVWACSKGRFVIPMKRVGYNLANFHQAYDNYLEDY